MENNKVGYLILGISILMIIIVIMFSATLKDIVTASCTQAHGDVSQCPMIKTINQQTYISYGLIGLLIIVSLVLIFSKKDTEIIIKKVEKRKHKKSYDLSGLRKEDQETFKMIENSKAVFQSDLIEKTGFGKAKMTRIIDRLEGKGLVERKRRGMTNVVVLKDG